MSTMLNNMTAVTVTKNMIVTLMNIIIMKSNMHRIIIHVPPTSCVLRHTSSSESVQGVLMPMKKFLFVCLMKNPSAMNNSIMHANITLTILNT